MNLDEAMYTFATFRIIWVCMNWREKKDLSSVCGPLMLSRFR